ncbi:MAG: SIS domain-containing protein [Bacteroidales bacterium]|jgi:D-sedoheptulose 7-phosphate isomerase|nr:SIS domain-containing protein [Bacteroidales bacterium]
MEKTRKAIEESIMLKQRLLNDISFLTRIEEAAALVCYSLTRGGKIHFCGNGGSAADAQHIAAELSGRFSFDRPPLNAEALHCNSSYLTAVANDYGYDRIFARLLQGTGKAGDVLVGFSTSGNSANVVQAFEMARQMDIATVALTGAQGNLLSFANILLNVPSTDTPRIQEAHGLIGHIICEFVENKLFVNEK